MQLPNPGLQRSFIRLNFVFRTSVSGSINGYITDASGAVIANTALVQTGSGVVDGDNGPE